MAKLWGRKLGQSFVPASNQSRFGVVFHARRVILARLLIPAYAKHLGGGWLECDIDGSLVWSICGCVADETNLADCCDCHSGG